MVKISPSIDPFCSLSSANHELLKDALARPIVRAATTWAFEERLFCATSPVSFEAAVEGLAGVAGAEEVLP